MTEGVAVQIEDGRILILFVVYTNSNAAQTSKYREATFDTVGRTVVVRRTGNR